MQLKLIRLSKYKRLMATNITFFEWTPTKNLMVMLGSNGSGKSSVMSELTPLPSNHSNFAKDGVREIHYYHNGILYQLKSVYDRGTGTHSFIRGDEPNLNPGGTFKVQEELCFKEFGIDREIDSILNGRIKFTQLSTGRRRELLTRMSTVDLTCAFDVFKMVTVEHRNQKGTIDTITKRLVTENQDIPSDTEMSLMREDVQRMTTRLNGLFQGRSNDAPKSQFYSTAEMQSGLDRLINQAKDLLRKQQYLPKRFAIASRDDACGHVQSLQQEHAAVTAVINRLAEELEKLQSSTPQSMEIDPKEIESLKAQLADHLKASAIHAVTVGEYTGVFPIVKFNIAGDPQAKLDALFERWFESINAFPDNSQGYFSREEATKKSERNKELNKIRVDLEDRFNTTRGRISVLKGCEHIACPNCRHQFQPGVDPKESEHLEAHQAKLSDALDRLAVEYKQNEQYLEDFNEYSSHVFGFVQLTRDYPEFREVWDYCAANLVMYRSPAQFKTEVINWHSCMASYIESEQALASAKILEKRLQIIEEIDQDAIGFMKRRTQDLENEIETLYHKAGVYKNDLTDLDEAIFEVDQYITSCKQIFADYEAWQDKVRLHAEHLLDKAFGEEIHAVQMRLAETGRQLNILQQREFTIKALENEVTTATEAFDELAAIIKAISPKGGLLGKYLMGFMQNVVTIVNACIDEVWTYPMEVLPSKVEKDELDYRFPLCVAGGKIITSDIEDGSDSQLEMVNLSFRMAMIKFLGMEDAPLRLDEFGRTFDEQHRSNLIPFITRLIENGQFKQIFYISHIVDTYGAFNQCEFMVLDPTNVTVPEAYNKNVILR